jgi:putative transposase
LIDQGHGNRLAYNRCLGIVTQQLDARRRDGSVVVPWSGFDLINSFNAWKRTAEAGRVMVVDRAGEITIVTTGLRWRTEVCQEVFEEAAVDLGRGLAAFTAAQGRWAAGGVSAVQAQEGAGRLVSDPL